MAQENVNIPITGMVDAHPLNVKESQYPFMLNGNTMTDISSAVTLTNEHSNYLCNNLPEGFVVIAALFAHDDKIVYLWLVNPSNGASEIGFLSEYLFTDVVDPYVANPCTDCAKKKDEAAPLETTDQPQLCVYTPIVTDGPCCQLGFNLDFPVRKGVLKKDNCGDSLYFTDFLNPPRVLKLQPGTHLPDNTIRCVEEFTPGECPEPVYDEDPTHVDCEAIRLFPLAAHMHIEPAVIGVGGTLVAGTYQLAACYADQFGQRATRTFATSNPASIFDRNKTVTDQVNYPTDKSIKFRITDIDNQSYRYIDLFVIATQVGVSTVRQFDTIDISSLIDNTLEFTLSDFEKGKPATIDDIFQVFPVYELAQEITTAGNCLLLGNLTGPKDLNLQQAVVYLSPFLQWKSYESDEALYADGAAAGNFRSFLRDELYTLGIVFERNNTLDTCVYPFIGRGINVVIDDGTVDPGCPNGYEYFGYWLDNGPTLGIFPDKAVVSYGTASYVNTSGLPSTVLDVPGASAVWTLVTVANAATFCILPDNDVIDNDDVIIPPGCEEVNPNLRWQVYNTAFNRGVTCDYTPGGKRCVQRIDTIVCNSFAYTVPTLIFTYTPGSPEFIAATEDSFGDTIQGMSSGAVGDVIGVHTDAAGNMFLILEAVVGAFTVGETIQANISGASGDVVNYVAGDPVPNDCYTDPDSQSPDCDDNYPTPFNDPSVEPSDPDCPPNPDPDISCSTSGPDECCNPGFVRSSLDAVDPLYPRLCVDETLAAYDASYPISNPYVIRRSSVPELVFPGSTSDYRLFDFDSIVTNIPDLADPTPALPTTPTDYSGCLDSTVVTPHTWLWKDITLPVNPPGNYVGSNPSSIIITPNDNCVYYQSPTVAPLMFFVGDDLGNGSAASPGDNPNAGCPTFAAWATNYWGITYSASGTVNNTLYQSYWNNFYATAAATTLVIKVKLFYKDGTAFAAGDMRIDVYKDTPFGTPVYSTGDTSAQFYYDASGTAGDIDAGVLIIGDVANSTGDTTAAGQTPLVAGAQYFVHIYLLGNNNTGGRGKVNNVQLNPDGSGDCPCYLPNYAWANICINSPTTEETVPITLPAQYQLTCTYDLYYRLTEVINSTCEVAPFNYGDFAYWEAATKKYPTSRDQFGRPLFGPLCGLPLRHFKFPDCLVSYLQDQDPQIVGDLGSITEYPFNSGRTARIYPMGLKLSTEDVKLWLDWAVSAGFITQTERNEITGYKIVRGNRAANKSIGAKGIITDMWNYNEFDWVSNKYSQYKTYFANFPFNDLSGSDPYLNRGGSAYTPPNGGISNSRFAFHSPETSFNSPTIGSELKLEASLFGGALGNFYQVHNHPKYVLLSSSGIGLAAALSAIQLAADLLILIGELLGNYLVGFSFTVPVGSIVGIVGAALNEVPKFFIYALQWEQLITNFGVPQNFAYYYAAVGNYHSSGVLGQILNLGNKRRGVNNSTYLLAGNLSINELGNLSKINNYQREDSVYFNLTLPFAYAGTAIIDTTLKDTSKFIMSQTPEFQTIAGTVQTDPNACGLVERKSQVAGYYSAMKYYMPDQYGSLQDIEWLYTGINKPVDFDEVQDTSCDNMLGGDEFIVRFTKYVKVPFFLDNPVGVVTGVDFQYRRISNITNSTYYFNSVGESILNASSIQFTEVEHKFDCETTGSGMYLKGNMYLFNYGVISFICESDFNLNYRRCTDLARTRCFYPYQSDVENATQEDIVPIEEPNHYLINRDYNKQNKENFFCSQPTIYNNSACLTTYRNRVISSIPDTDADFYRDNWRIFLGADYKDYPLTNGFLWGLDGIERDKVVLRFSDTTLVLNAFYTINTNAGAAQLGSGSLFSTKPEELVKASIGFGGTQSHAFISTPVGHFWVDAERHKVFVMPPSQPGVGSMPASISDSYDTFFITNLPFFVLQDFPNFVVDNPYKDVGISMDWDYRFNRLFLTKLDYSLLPQWKAMAAVPLSAVTPTNPALHYFGPNELPFNPAGVYLVTTDGVVTEYTAVELTDTAYFCNKSWTISYSPILKTWISFYSFVPNYYIGHAKYMQTGVNFVRPGADRTGIWNHFISNKSYQVFYGTLYPFMTDVIVQEQLYNKQLHSIEYQADFLRFQNDYDYFYNPGVTFNKMVIWSENQNSGNLELVPKVQNDFSQSLLYPRINLNSTSVLVARTENNWNINQFVDLVADKYSNVPPMILGCSPYLRVPNPDAINYNKPTFQRQHITSDYMTMRFINDVYSNYKIINKWFFNKTIKSYS